jgi:hypothetical protein
MAYTLTSDPTVLDIRRRMLTEFRAEMKGIDDCYPQTYAASMAVEALTHYTPDPMSEEQAGKRLRAAGRLVRKGASPIQIYEGLLQLEEILDGYPSGGSFTGEASDLYNRTQAAHADRLLDGVRVYRRVGRSAQEVLARVSDGGIRLSNDDILDCVDRLNDIQAVAGEGSLLAARIGKELGCLEEAWSDRIFPGVVPGRSDKTTGVGIRRVLAGSAAAKAGLAGGDVIVRVDGNDVKSVDDLQRIVSGFEKGQEIALVVRRTGEENLRDLRLKLDRLPSRSLPEERQQDEPDRH